MHGVGELAPQPARRARWAGWLLCAFAPALQAQDRAPQPYGVTWWNISNGLPQSSINDLLQGEDGALWCATFGGLLRFDGVEFRVFDLDSLPGMDSNRVTALAPDGEGGLWFATQTGRIRRLRDGVLGESLQLDEAVLAMLRADDGALWVQTLGGAVSRHAQGAWRELVPKRWAGSYEGLCRNGDGSISAAVGRAVVIFELDGGERERFETPSRVTAVGSSRGARPWIGLQDGVARFRGEEIVRVTIEPPVDTPVTVLREDERGLLWAGHEVGVARVPISPDVRPELVIESSSDLARTFSARSMLIDREGCTWIGSSIAGLMHVRPRRVESMYPRPWPETITALCSDAAGGAWMGGIHGLRRLTPGMLVAPVRPQDVYGVGRAPVHSLLCDADGRVWVGVDERVLRREPDPDAEFEPIPGELAERRFLPSVGPLAESATRDVWIADARGGLARFGPDDVLRETSALPERPLVLLCAQDGTLWAGGEQRLHRVRAGRVESFGAEHGLPGGGVRDILEGEDGELWLATYGGGLARFDGGRIQKLTRREGLPDNALTAILPDGRGRLWILSNLGLIVAERSELLEVLSGRRASFEPVVLGPEAGMNEATFAVPAAFDGPDGKLWFAAINGAAQVDAAAFPFNEIEPRTHIERVRADGTELPLADPLEVPAGTRRLTIDYVSFALSAPARVRYRYRMEGFDERWIENGAQRRAVFTDLEPGPYTFSVLARNEDGVWGTQADTLRLEVQPSWWQTLVFRIAVVLAAGMLLLTLHRVRLRVVGRRTQALLEATRERGLAEERASRLREELAHVARVATAGELATSLAHEVNQPLAAIVTNAQAARRFLARERRAEVEEILGEIAQQGQRASEVIQRLRDFLRKHPPEPAPQDVSTLVTKTLPLVRREIEDQHVELELELDEHLPAVEIDEVGLQQVLVNLVKNACEALAEVAGTRRLVLRTLRAEGQVRIEVQDNGPGITPEIAARLFQPFVTTKRHGMGLGLAICRSIVEAHGGRLAILPAAGGGALFRIDLPVWNGPR